MSDPRKATPLNDLRNWPKDAVRVCFGVVWLIDASLKWLPGFRASFLPTIMAEAQGQPGWLKWWFDFWINFQHPRALFFAYFVAVIETLIALAVTFGIARKFSYISAACSASSSGQRQRASVGRTHPGQRTSGLRSSTSLSSYACWPSPITRVPADTPSITTSSSASHGGGGLPKCAGPLQWECLARPRLMRQLRQPNRLW
jgi:hypothetical protein